MKIKVINKSKHKLPEYSKGTSAGMDLHASLDNPIIIKPMERILVPTDLFIDILIGYEAQIRPQSGLAIKKRIIILNSPGTINADYRGEFCIIPVNLSNENFVIEDGVRICQKVISEHEKAEWKSVDTLLDSEGGAGRFGHTGKNLL